MIRKEVDSPQIYTACGWVSKGTDEISGVAEDKTR